MELRNEKELYPDLGNNGGQNQQNGAYPEGGEMIQPGYLQQPSIFGQPPLPPHNYY